MDRFADFVKNHGGGKIENHGGEKFKLHGWGREEGEGGRADVSTMKGRAGGWYRGRLGRSGRGLGEGFRVGGWRVRRLGRSRWYLEGRWDWSPGSKLIFCTVQDISGWAQDMF